MYKTLWSHKRLVINILCKSFEKDPLTNWYINSFQAPGKKRKRLCRLFEFTFVEAMIQGNIYISDKNEGCAIWLYSGKKKFSIKKQFAELKFLLAFGIKQTKKVIEMRNCLHKKYNSDNFLYLHILGVIPEQQKKGIASSLLKPVLENSKKKNIPVLLETSTKQNVLIYEKLGFKLYHTWDVPEEKNLVVYFLQKD